MLTARCAQLQAAYVICPFVLLIDPQLPLATTADASNKDPPSPVPVAAHDVVLGGVSHHDALVRRDAPGVADVQQRSRAGLVGEVTLARDGWQEGRHGQVVLVEVVHTARERNGREEANRRMSALMLDTFDAHTG
jgi:hypothetical protein